VRAPLQLYVYHASKDALLDAARLTALGARAIAVLAVLEALASWHGLTPPGLAHARRFVPADAASTGATANRGGDSVMA
jgi:hypothetical protein